MDSVYEIIARKEYLENTLLYVSESDAVKECSNHLQQIHNKFPLVDIYSKEYRIIARQFLIIFNYQKYRLLNKM